MLSDLYKADLPRRSESTIRGRPRGSNVTLVSEIVSETDDGTTATDVSIIKMTPSRPVANKAATTPTNKSTIKVTRSTTSISPQNIRYTRNLILQSRRSTRAKI